MTIRRGYAWTTAALLGAGVATVVSAQSYDDMAKGAAKDAAKQQAADSANQAVGGTGTTGGAGVTGGAGAAPAGAGAPIDTTAA